MSRKIFTILLLFTALFSGCINKENIEHTIAGNNKLVVEFSVQGNVGVKSGAEDPLAFESKVTHLDMFFFDISNSNLYHYERISVAEGETGNKVIHGLSLKTICDENKTLKIYVVANSSKTEEYFKGLHTQGNPLTISDLKSEIETTTYVNITGFEGLDVDAPDTFLMTGLAVKSDDSSVPVESTYSGIDFSDWDFNEDFNIKVTLVRSAAKVEVTFIKKVGSNHIYAFGKPSIATGEEFTVEGEYTYSYADMSYYMRNLRYKTHFWNDVAVADNMRKTNPITNSGYMVANADQIKVTVYIYSCSWGGQTSSVFETAPFLIVNLPAVIYTDKENNKAKYVAQNFYEIPLRQIASDSDGNESTTGTAYIERNHYYNITATVDAAGSQSSMVPYKLNPVLYDVYAWDNKEVNVGTSEKAKFLSLSTSSIEMRNTSSNSDIKFSSSSPVTVTRTNAYYVNKFGNDITVTFPTASAPSGVLNGNITVNSEIPQDTKGLDNVVVYMTFTVTNNDGLSQQFTVTQYPTVYIQGILSHFSYRTDFGANYADGKGSNGYVSADVRTVQSNGSWWKLSNSVGSSYTTFQSKVVASSVRSDGTALLQFYYWSGNSRKQKNVQNNSPLYLNPRMYQITITSSSSEYKVGRPQLTSEGYTASDDANNELVSPSFMIASGLGSTLSISSTEAAKDHCSKYAEAYTDENGKYVKLEDWRLPTKAEIGIIVKFQQESNAMDEVLTGSHYHCANGVVATGIAGAQSTTALRCIRDVYKSPSN